MTSKQRREITEMLRRVIGLIDGMEGGPTEIMDETPIDNTLRIDEFVKKIYHNIMVEFGKAGNKDDDSADLSLRTKNRFANVDSVKSAIKRIQSNLHIEFKLIKRIILRDEPMSVFETKYRSRIDDFINKKYDGLRKHGLHGISKDRYNLENVFKMIHQDGPMMLIVITVTDFFRIFIIRNGILSNSTVETRPLFSDIEVETYRSMLQNAASSGTENLQDECQEILQKMYPDGNIPGVISNAYADLCERAVVL